MENELYFNTFFVERECPHCHNQVKPVALGKTNPDHGYALNCPACDKFIGWGGKNKKIINDEGKRVESSIWSPKRLCIDYCQICLRPEKFLGKTGKLETHHLLPISLGGEDIPKNILIACTSCHKEIHHRQTYINDHMKPFFDAYIAYQKLKIQRPELFVPEGE